MRKFLEDLSYPAFMCLWVALMVILTGVGIVIDYQIKKAAAKAAIKEVQREMAE